MGGMSSGSMNQGMSQGKRANSQKPSSAPSKNRIRSQSPINGESGGNQTTQAYSGQSQSNKQKNLIGSIDRNNFGPSGQSNNKMMSNTGGFGGMMTQGQSVGGSQQQ